MFIFRNMFLFFTLVALAEVMVFIEVGEWIGLLWTVVMVVLTAAVGVTLLRVEGFDTLRRIQQATAEGRLPGVEIIEGIMLLVAGALLLTPGFLTDLFGFLLLIKPSRTGMAKALLARGAANFIMTQRAQGNPFQNSGASFYSRAHSGRHTFHQSHQSRASTQNAGSAAPPPEMDAANSASADIIEGEFVEVKPEKPEKPD